jgi:acyl-CoA reductase-like NAD-dependent aldehyde dehydrogenase
VAFFSFIGSARVGWYLRSRLAPGTRCALQHGGAAPVLVDRNSDLGSVVPALAKGGFYHAGQVCVSVQRVFADQVIAERLAQRLAEAGGFKDIDFALGTASQPTASAVMVNGHTAFRVDWMPFAGLKESGLGVGGIPHSFRDMRIEKLIVVHSPRLWLEAGDWP